MNSRGVALIIVLAFILSVVVLTNIALALIVSQFSLTQHKTRRISAFYFAQAGINYALEKLRTGDWVYDTYYCINGAVDGGVTCTETVADTDISYNVQIRIWPEGGGSSPIPGTTQLEAKVEYTYAP